MPYYVKKKTARMLVIIFILLVAIMRAINAYYNYQINKENKERLENDEHYTFLAMMSGNTSLCGQVSEWRNCIMSVADAHQNETICLELEHDEIIVACKAIVQDYNVSFCGSYFNGSYKSNFCETYFYDYLGIDSYEEIEEFLAEKAQDEN
jgi:hypothetical protein